jgi:hypothetical protein
MSKEEERAAQRILDEAVENFIRVMKWGEGMVMTGWALVGHQAGFDDEGNDRSSYPIIYQGGSMPDHAAIGLFRIGIDTVRGVGRWGTDEE